MSAGNFVWKSFQMFASLAVIYVGSHNTFVTQIFHLSDPDLLLMLSSLLFGRWRHTCTALSWHNNISGRECLLWGCIVYDHPDAHYLSLAYARRRTTVRYAVTRGVTAWPTTRTFDRHGKQDMTLANFETHWSDAATFAYNLLSQICFAFLDKRHTKL